MLRSLKRWAIGGALLSWAAVMLLLVSSLMVSHWISLPHPEAEDANWIAQLNKASLKLPSDEWVALHVLYADCPCSRRVLKKVVQRKPFDHVRERIVLIGEHDALASVAEQQGYEVDYVTPVELKQHYGLESAPFFVVLAPDRTAKYAGGYTSRKQGPDIQDAEILTSLLSGQDVESMPLYGCAVSDNLKAIVDPLGLKYRGQ